MTQPETDKISTPARISAQLPLADVSVVECGQGVAAAFCTKLMALLGAEVIKVEPPKGDIVRRRGPFPRDIPDPENSGLFLYLNADKRGVTLDLTDPADRLRLNDLLAGADILIHNVPPLQRADCGLDSAALCRSFPSLIVSAISAYGGFGPRANYHAYELNAAHATGMAALTPRFSPYPELPPLKFHGHQAELQAGVHAAIATMGAFWHRLQNRSRTGDRRVRAGMHRADAEPFLSAVRRTAHQPPGRTGKRRPVGNLRMRRRRPRVHLWRRRAMAATGGSDG